MPTFKYKALNKDTGETVEEEAAAANKAALFKEVQKTGMQVVSAEEITTGSWFNWEKLKQKFSTVATHDKISFARNLSAMIDAGLTVSRALSVIERQTGNPRFQYILRDMQTKISEGQSLHAAMSNFPKTFSDLFVAMVKAGEESGNLSDSLSVVSTQMDQAYQLKRKVRGAMIYPAIVIAIMIIIGVLMLVFIVPTLQSTFADIGADLPLSTRAIIATSNFVQHNPLILLGLIATAGAGVWYAFRTSWGKRAFEWLILRIPMVGNLVKEVNSARTTRTLSSLLTAGVDMLEALEITGEVIQNSYYREVIDAARARVQKGENISAVMGENEDLYPVFVGEMASVGEETGKLDEMLLEVATFYEDDVSQKTKNMSQIVEPFLMVIIGLGVGFFAYAMLMPMYSLVDKI